MKCIILAAGYATRLYPLTENFPKPLLDIGGTTIIDKLVDDIKNCGIDEFIVVSNHKFISFFNDWKKKRNENIIVIDDGSTSNDNRLGAVKDILYSIKECSICDDILVIAADNILDFSMKSFIDYFKCIDANCVMRYFEKEASRLKKTGIILFDKNNMIVDMQEKPSNPKSNWAVPPFYIFKHTDLKLFEEGINDGCKVDAPGNYIEWLCKRTSVYAMEMPGNRIDIGTIESYNDYLKKGI